tara:strand:- start:17507 stop:18157 length:651 start_codon:yes stop_codon:yes gene_type:complete
MTIIKDVALKLIEGIPSWLRGAILTLMVVFGGMYFLGFNYDNFRVAQQVTQIKKQSILLSGRSAKDSNEFANKIVTEVYEMTESYGVALFGLEPDYIPKVIKVVARDGARIFKDYVEVGKKTHISSRLPNVYLSLREGLSYKQNLASDGECKLMDMGVRSMIAHPIVYRGITIGTMIVFLDRPLESYSVEELEEMDGEIRMACVVIVEKLYYNEDK